MLLSVLRVSYISGESVGWGGLVDVIVVGVAVGTARRGLSLSSAHRAALHHTAAHISGGVLGCREWIALLRHHPENKTESLVLVRH